MKKLFLFISVICMISTLFTINVLAADIEVGKCDTTDPICIALQEKYGTDSTVIYSTVETTTCANQLTVNVNGEDRIVYVSAKPSNDNDVVAPPVIDENTGNIPDDGIVIKPGDSGINEIELPKTEVLSDNLLSSDNIVDNLTTDVDEVAIHNKLVEIYGNKTDVYWNTVSTSRCKYASSVQVNGVQVTVYLSQKPTTGDVGVQMGEDGKLIIDGISSDDNIVNHITYSIKQQNVGYPYNAINEKLIYIFGSNQDVRYFIEDDIESVKTILANKNKNYDEIMSDFYAIDIGIETGVKKVYVNKELTSDQEALLNSDLNSETCSNNEPSETNSNIIQILLIISLIVNVVVVGAFVLTIKKHRQ